MLPWLHTCTVVPPHPRFPPSLLKLCSSAKMGTIRRAPELPETMFVRKRVSYSYPPRSQWRAATAHSVAQKS